MKPYQVENQISEFLVHIHNQRSMFLSTCLSFTLLVSTLPNMIHDFSA